MKVVLTRRGRRRDFRRLRPLPQRDAAVVAGRAGDVRARHLRPGGRAARAAGRLARRHRRGRGARGGRRPLAPGGGAGHRHGRLAAARPAAEAGPLPDGARGGGAHAVPRSRRGGGGVPPARCDEAARRHGQVDPAQVAGEAPADGAAVRAEAGLHRAGRRVDQGPGRAARAAGGGAAGRGGDRRSRARGGAVPRHPPLARTASPRGSCCSTRCGTARHILGLPPAGDVFETLAAR